MWIPERVSFVQDTIFMEKRILGQNHLKIYSVLAKKELSFPEKLHCQSKGAALLGGVSIENSHLIFRRLCQDPLAPDDNGYYSDQDGYEAYDYGEEDDEEDSEHDYYF